MSNTPQKISLPEWLILIFIFIVTAIGFIWSYQDHDSFKAIMVTEDGFTEWMTVVAFSIIFIVCVRRLWLLRKSKSKSFLAVIGLMALAAFFAVGEEVSWGQRLVGIESPEFFEKHNAQGETNLHNLMIGDVKINKVVFGKGIGIGLLTYLLIIIPIYHRKARLKAFLDRYAVPIAKGYQVAAYLIILLVVQGVMDSSKKGEMLEFAFSFLFLLTIAFPHNQNIYNTVQPRDVSTS